MQLSGGCNNAGNDGNALTYDALPVLRLGVEDAGDGEACGICELWQDEGQAEVVVVARIVTLCKEGEGNTRNERGFCRGAPER